MKTTFKIVQTKYFEKKFNKIIPKQYKENVKKQIKTLKKEPFQGKPLSYKFIRELKINKFRVYFAIYEKEIIILLITVSEKKIPKRTNK